MCILIGTYVDIQMAMPVCLPQLVYLCHYVHFPLRALIFISFRHLYADCYTHCVITHCDCYLSPFVSLTLMQAPLTYRSLWMTASFFTVGSSRTAFLLIILKITSRLVFTARLRPQFQTPPVPNAPVRNAPELRSGQQFAR